LLTNLLFRFSLGFALASNTPSVPKRLRSNPDSKTIYAKATALECLVGYLYLTDPARLAEIMDVLDMRTDEKIKVKG